MIQKVYFYNPDVLSRWTIVDWAAKEQNPWMASKGDSCFNILAEWEVTTLSCWVKDKTEALTWLHTVTVGIFGLKRQTGKCITPLKLFSAMTLYTDRYLNVLFSGNSLLADDWLFHDSAILDLAVVSNYVPNFTNSFLTVLHMNGKYWFELPSLYIFLSPSLTKLQSCPE